MLRDHVVPAFVSTAQFAKILGIQSKSIVRYLCINGHYLGIKPRKLPNGRLMWPVAKIQTLLGVES